MNEGTCAKEIVGFITYMYVLSTYCSTAVQLYV